MAGPLPISIVSLRGGMNDVDAPHMLPEDQCVLAENVEFFYSSMGERRLGCEAVDLTGSGLLATTAICHLSQRVPTNDLLSPEYWAVGVTPNVSTVVSRGGPFGTWVSVVPTDPILPIEPDVYSVQAQPIHGKHFFGYHSGQDRFHVWDGLTLRRTGLAQPSAPTGANTGGGTYAATLRYYRIRYLLKIGGKIIVRSEPSTSLTFTPSGAGTGVVVTKPASIGEGETDWELEVSLDNSTFYRLATTGVGTTTVTDSAATTTYSSNTQSEAIGAYLLLPAARFAVADQDRLVLAGHWTDPDKQSLLMWTPPSNDPGVGNDERLPIVTTGGANITTSTSLDNNEGGALTGLAMATAGVGYAFKWGSIYAIHRTLDNTRAYDVSSVTHARGAIPGSVVDGVDSTGSGCVYFLDPVFGPSRIGPGGLETIRGLRQTWQRVNTAASLVTTCAVYYPNKQQVHWWVAADGSNTPTLIIKLQIDQIREAGTGAGPVATRGWSIATGRISNARCAAALTEAVDINGLIQLSTRPFIGLTSPDFVQRCDTQDTDAGQTYVARIRTRAYTLTGLLGKWGAMLGVLLATANATKSVAIRLIRDYGLETVVSPSIPLASSAANEEAVIKVIDDLHISGATAVQFEFRDA